MPETRVTSNEKPRPLNTRDEFFAAIERYKKQLSPEGKAPDQEVIPKSVLAMARAPEEFTASVRKAQQSLEYMRSRAAESVERMHAACTNVRKIAAIFNDARARSCQLSKLLSPVAGVISHETTLTRIVPTSVLVHNASESFRNIAQPALAWQKMIDGAKQSIGFATRGLHIPEFPALPVGYSGIVEAFLGKDAYFTHVQAVADPNASDQDRLRSIKRLLETKHKIPIARQRWKAHRTRLTAAIRERAELLNVSGRQAFDEASQQALFKVCVELKHPRARTRFVTRNRRFFVRGLIAWEDLGVTRMEAYIRNRLSDEMMDILVPAWRQFDTKKAIENTPEFIRIDDASTNTELMRAHDISHQTDIRSSTSELLTHSELSEDQRMLMRLMVEKDLSATAAGLQMGKSEAWGRVTISRIRKKLKKIS